MHLNVSLGMFIVLLESTEKYNNYMINNDY